jgi:signal peptidase I
MNVQLNFALIMVVLTALTGAIWLIDHIFFVKRRKQLTQKDPVVVEYAKSFFPVILLVLLVRSFLAEPFRIPSDSMMPTLLDGDFILVNKFAYGLRVPVADTKFFEIGAPQRGDVVVFRRPDTGEDYIKRVIGLPGDEIEYRNGVLFVNGERVMVELVGAYEGVSETRDYHGYARVKEALTEVTHDALLGPPPGFNAGPQGVWKVGQGEYLMMGDNRSNSQDGRSWGMVPERFLVGKAFFIWMNWDSKRGTIGFDRIGTAIK